VTIYPITSINSEAIASRPPCLSRLPHRHQILPGRICALGRTTIVVADGVDAALLNWGAFLRLTALHLIELALII
jgi:hypothetical protein